MLIMAAVETRFARYRVEPLTREVVNYQLRTIGLFGCHVVKSFIVILSRTGWVDPQNLGSSLLCLDHSRYGIERQGQSRCAISGSRICMVSRSSKDLNGV